MFNFVGMKHSYVASRMSFTVALVVSSALALSRAEIVATESFDYDTPTIRGCKGGEGWADGWTGDNLISHGSFRYPDYATKGNRLTTSEIPRGNPIRSNVRFARWQ
jgi:hypothetical protein